MSEQREFSPQPPAPKGKIIRLPPMNGQLIYFHKESADSARARCAALAIFIFSKWILDKSRLN